MQAPSPERILHYAIGGWMSGVVAAASRHHLFAHLASGAATRTELARAARISERGAQALLDGLVGLGLVVRSGPHHRCSPEAMQYLVPGSSPDLGDLFELQTPIEIGALASVAGAIVRGRVGLDETGLRVLDLGGAAADWESHLPNATITRVGVDDIERAMVGGHDLVLIALISHRLTAERLAAVYRHARSACAPDGMLVAAEPMLADDRTGDAWVLTLSAYLSMCTDASAVHRRCDYERWLRDAGFADIVEEQPDDWPFRLLYAR